MPLGILPTVVLAISGHWKISQSFSCSVKQTKSCGRKLQLFSILYKFTSSKNFTILYNMTIKMSLKKNNFQMMWEWICNKALSTTGNIAIGGNVMNSYLTEGNVNSLFKNLYSCGKKVHWFLDQETKDVMEQDARTKYLLSRGNINNVVDWKQFKLGEDMKFTGIILNPPYGNLHLPILKDSLEHADWEHDAQVVCIHPANWLQFPTKKRPDWMNDHIKEFNIVDRKTANETFDIDGGDLVISEFCKDGKSFTGDAANDPEFCCFKFNSIFV